MDHQKILKDVEALLESNMVQGFSKSTNTSFHFTKPSPDTYPFQFFWDTCFHAFILCSLGKADMAKSHLQSMFALQDEDGFVGHIIYWNRKLPGRSTDVFQSKPSLKQELLMSHMSALLQPPIIAQAVARVYAVSNDLDFLKNFLPKLKRYYTYIATHRDFHGDGLITIISPFESGMDWKASFDEVLGFSGKANWKLFLKAVSVDFRNFYHGYNLDKIKEQDYFHVKEVGFNTVYIQNLYELAKLCREVNDPDEEYFSRLADKATKSLKDLMYDEEAVAFFDLYGRENKKLKVFTPTVFFPVVIESIDQDIAHKLIKKHFIDADGFSVKYPIPSLVMKVVGKLNRL